MSTLTADRPQTSTAFNSKICPKHKHELEIDSGISSKLIALNIRTLNDAADIAEFLNLPNWNRGPGWASFGYNPKTKGIRTEGQFKPDNPTPKNKGKKDGKFNKYLSAWKKPTRIFFPLTDNVEQIERNLKDIKIPMLKAEGVKKALVLTDLGYFAVSVPGVRNGVKDGKLHSDFDEVELKQKIVVFCYDADMWSNEKVRDALLIDAELNEKEGAIVKVAIWEEKDGKGIDDLYKNKGEEAVREAVDNAIPLEEFKKKLEAQYKEDSSQPGSNDKPGEKPEPQHYAAEIAEEEKNSLIWRSEIEFWTKYGEESTGIWTLLKWDVMQRFISIKMDADPRFCKGYSQNYLKEVIEHLRNRLLEKKWMEAEPQKYIPFIDGVLEVSTMTLLPHDPSYRFTWMLPYNWSDRDIGCETILDWLLEVNDDKEDRRQLLRAFLKALLTGRYDQQIFLEISGTTRTGKSTFGKLATAVVGYDNVFATSLRKLEKNNFELAGAVGKRLLLVPDACRYAGEAENFRSITGGDPLGYEKKHQQVGTKFVFKGLSLLIDNVPVQFDETSPAIDSRRINVPFDVVIPPMERKQLIDFQDGKAVGEFAPEIPALIAWALAMPDSEMVHYLKNTDIAVPSLREFEVERKSTNDPLFGWMQNNTTYAKDGPWHHIGDKEQTISDEGLRVYKNQDDDLYPNYVSWCERNGHKPISQRLFSKAVVDKCHHLGLKEVHKDRDSKGRVITNIRLKRGHPDVPGLVSYADSLKNAASCSINAASMTAESLGSAGNAAYAASIQKSFVEPIEKEITSVSTPPEPQVEPQIEKSFSPEAAQATDPAPELVSADTASDINAASSDTTDNLGFEEGEHVEWENRPSDRKLQRIFRIEEIEGNYAHLINVQGRVPLCELSKLQR